MFELFHTILYAPIYNALIWLYTHLWFDMGFATIALTVLLRTLMIPFSFQQIKSQKSMQDLQPKVEALKQQYKGNQEELGKAMLALYKQEKVNPLSSCLPTLIQLPFLWAMYQVFRTGLDPASLQYVYSFIAKPDTLNNIAFGFLDLSKRSIALAVAAGVAQYLQVRMLMAKKPPVHGKGTEDEERLVRMNKMMMYFLPGFIFILSLSFPAGLSLYWFVITVFTIGQQWFMLRRKKSSSPTPPAQEVLPAPAK